ncbi:MAG: phosphotransferase enzyme family protein [Lachnospiraceae bacterium]
MNYEFSIEKKLREIASIFHVNGTLASYEVITTGNINSTYWLKFSQGNGVTKTYIMQRVNTYVFKKPQEIMSNISLVTNHIRSKSIPGQQTLMFYVTDEGKNYYDDGEGNFWRMSNHIDSVSFDSCDELSIMEAVGAAFGEFQNMLSDFDASKLYETIPDFHNTKKRIEKLYESIEKDEYGRVEQVSDEIAFVKEHDKLASQLTLMLEKGEVPLRVTHNDTKINNVLFDKKTHYPIAIIDLDTVMPGLAMHDFGDAVRFACNTAAEDEKNLDLVSLDLTRFQAFAQGFIGKTANSLTEQELETMVLGAITITIELGVRFLDDYITGDKYFKTLYDGHNLVRTRCQFALAKDMLKKREAMEYLIRDIVSQC